MCRWAGGIRYAAVKVARSTWRSNVQRHWAALRAPDVGGVVLDGAVGGKEPARRDVQEALPRPRALVAAVGADLILACDVSFVVRQQTAIFFFFSFFFDPGQAGVPFFFLRPTFLATVQTFERINKREATLSKHPPSPSAPFAGETDVARSEWGWLTFSLLRRPPTSKLRSRRGRVRPGTEHAALSCSGGGSWAQLL